MAHKDEQGTERTVRLPHIKKALDTGKLNAPAADEPEGKWVPPKKGKHAK